MDNLNSFCMAVNEWEQHCERNGMSSNPSDYRCTSAEQVIVRMGTEVLSLIKKYLEMELDSDILPTLWIEVVEQITREPIVIPSSIRGNMDAIRRYLISVLR